jgi:general secretion pathway protein G
MPSTHRRRRLRRTEGMTLVEIMIVVIIMALIATAVGVAVVPQWRKSQKRQTLTDAQAVKAGVLLFMTDNNGCPSGSAELQEEGYLDRSKRATDAWDNEFQVECEGDDIYVVSAGPDGQFGTEDDIDGPEDVE